MAVKENQFKFCPQCSGSFIQKKEHLLVCSSCKFEYYVNPKPCNAMIVENEKGEILLVKRGREPQKGWWDLPGGFIDLDETAEESMKREAQEELNISLKNIRYFMSTPDVYEYNNVMYQTICFVFTAEIASGEMTPSDDVSEYAFFAKEKINIEEIAFEGLRKAMSKYLEIQK